MVNIGDHIKCPECSRMARVVWVSKDGKTAGIQCPATHRQLSRPNSKLGSTARPRSKTDRNMVFLMEVK
jgi:ribosomal protein L44E